VNPVFGLTLSGLNRDGKANRLCGHIQIKSVSIECNTAGGVAHLAVLE